MVVPVLNEAGNVSELIRRLRTTLDKVSWEVIFVDDDSSDDTRSVVKSLGLNDNRVRLLHRVGRRGLASAFVEGAQASLSPFVAAMDGDLQHDETLLPRMLAVLRSEPVDVVIGSRYVPGGSLGDWDAGRARLSGLATGLTRAVIRTDVADPMSGFFMLRREVFERALPRISGVGFKILLDVLASLPSPPVVRELPFRFGTRAAGHSKMDTGVLFDFALLLLDKLSGGLVPVRFIVFAVIGLMGVVAHLVVLSIGLHAGLRFALAQGVATFAAIIGNFVLNNVLTFRDRRLKGWRAVRGLVVFALACGIGALANLNVAALMVDAGHQTWWAAGLVGAAMSLVWNYAVGSTVTWRRR